MPRVTARSLVEKRALAWCRRVHPPGLGRSARVAELYDHLMCDVEARVASGVLAEQAFQEAVTRMGTSGDLAAEQAKIQGLAKWSTVLIALGSSNARVLGERTNAKERNALILGTTLFFAALTIVTFLRLAGTPYIFLTLMCVVSWAIPLTALSTVRNAEGDSTCRS